MKDKSKLRQERGSFLSDRAQIPKDEDENLKRKVSGFDRNEP